MWQGWAARKSQMYPVFRNIFLQHTPVFSSQSMSWYPFSRNKHKYIPGFTGYFKTWPGITDDKITPPVLTNSTKKNPYPLLGNFSVKNPPIPAADLCHPIIGSTTHPLDFIRHAICMYYFTVLNFYVWPTLNKS